MAWLLALAGVFETGFAVLLKQSNRITSLAPWHPEVGPARAVRTGIGAAVPRSWAWRCSTNRFGL